MSAERAKIYDLDQVSVIFAGLSINNGIGEGGKIAFKKVDPDFTYKKGADGSVIRSKTGSKVWEITIDYGQTAQANATLSTINGLDNSLPNGAGVAPFLLKDNQGLDLFAATQAWIEASPDAEFAQEASNRSWKLIAADGVPFWGGA